MNEIHLDYFDQFFTLESAALTSTGTAAMQTPPPGCRGPYSGKTVFDVCIRKAKIKDVDACMPKLYELNATKKTLERKVDDIVHKSDQFYICEGQDSPSILMPAAPTEVKEVQKATNSVAASVPYEARGAGNPVVKLGDGLVYGLLGVAAVVLIYKRIRG